MKVLVNGHEFKDWKILDGYLYIKCGFGYTLAYALEKSGYKVEVKMEKAELKEKYCCRCVNADCDCNCIAKYEAPFGSFICDNGEMFEEYFTNDEQKD